MAIAIQFVGKWYIARLHDRLEHWLDKQDLHLNVLYEFTGTEAPN